ncbi:MAG: tRNA (guanine(10)-N(2))-dimethyltransferase [Candidatus ainarchaeum sp.]|nr:tRNA (guanine(10)-N(2))-dimethyltransferase [Candidatus ainarchaeum sp.]
MKHLEEDGITFSTAKTVFYNPAMRLCRSMSSLAVGAIGEKLEVVDAFCASGIRGIRYAKENKNVKKLTFIDIDKRAIALAKKNAKTNKLKADAVVGNISRLAFEHDADFLEIDPFGTPSPYLVDAFRYFNTKKLAYLSVTATDVAVLCGGKTAACMKNYHSRPMNNEFTHETGLRIMLKKVTETAAEFNMGITPLVSFSDKHYLKSVVMVKRSADLAYDSLKQLGHISFCNKCGFRSSGVFPERSCANCGAENDYAGPLWLGELHDPSFIGKMLELNQKRKYADREQMDHMLSLMLGEIGMPPYFYNVHALCKLQQLKSVPKMDDILAKLRKSGHKAVRTHFSPVAIKTAAPYKDVLGVLGWKS